MEAYCPECGEEAETVRETAEHITLRCTQCGVVSRVSPRHVRVAPLSLVVSEGSTSRRERMEAPDDAQVRLHDEFEHGGVRLRVTGIEQRDGTRPDAALVRDIQTLFCVTFDTVRLRYTVNRGETTDSLEEEVEPETPITIGRVREPGGVAVAVKALKSDQNRTVRKGFLLARNVVRVFADPAPGKSAGDRVVIRSKRGPAPAGASRPRRGPPGPPRRQ